MNSVLDYMVATMDRQNNLLHIEENNLSPHIQSERNNNHFSNATRSRCQAHEYILISAETPRYMLLKYNVSFLKYNC